ncbi:pantoate--beta-alanine ligase [Roseomonas eburnea]|uniref:Pantothenate synthetase n=1 Tax=Neoroseomonas eburnea TaxID=1346889 RepID=A0A9X9X8H8_9PROT|nr:pantoate--beta-alanine ligase [Neoroseomonas eburnea]MBR0680014.1 pantoate--beta-alanine ligase [Neoroseomonas eburnea]
MQICRDLPSLRAATAALRAAGKRLALVPTMGALHEGHLSLVAAGRREADAVAASIFVNPLQFGANEDLARYPRDEEGDLAKLRAAGCDLAWMPPVEAMYPPGSATVIEVAGPSAGWEGDARPGHFRGVATVCCKLFQQTQAEVAAFGEKDWQQLQVVTRMARDLDIPIRILPVETVREADGLALSSRNRFLSAQERATAPVLHRAMTKAAAAIAAGAPVASALGEGLETLRDTGFAPDYLALVEAETLKPLTARRADGPMRLIAAARLGTVRLLDNIPVG